MRKMRTSAVLLLAVCLLVAAVAGGCGEEKNGIGKATPGAAKTTLTPADKPTGKVTGSVTETLTPAADTPTAEPTETPTPLPTDSPTPLPTDSPTPTPSPSPTPYPEPELVSATTDVNSVRVTWNGDPAETYVVSYRAEGSDETLFVRAEGLLCAVTGLNPGTQYTLSLRRESDPEGTKLGQELKATTAVTGYGDPFRNAQTTLKVGEKSRVVTFTATEGCLGAKVWLEFDTELYEDPMLQHAIYPEGYEPAENAADDPDGQDGQDSGDGQTTQPGSQTFAGGTAFTVTGGHEGYCFLKEDGFYSLHISNEEIDAWVDAERLLIDAMDIFTPEEGPYGIRINRTNAYSSIFSTGGSAYSVDAESEEETRYTMLESEETIWTDTGYNVIEGISGEKLPHYGSELQMPVIWGIARNLLICQKNALASGTTLLIYEGYRPNLTSRTVYRTMVSKRYLDVSVGGYNLANGYTGKDYNAARYIANDSNHNKGIAVDLTIMNYVDTETLGEELPMQTKMHTLDFRGNMLYNNDNSNLLYEIMTQGTDLVPLKSGAEWWHFQLPGDAAKYPQLSKYVFADYEL